tara:strand:+ start:5603 stop:5797 length:195 start_codon:yes stop_codon:yes gene_type:complete
MNDEWNKNAMEYGESLSPQDEIKDLKHKVKKLEKKVKKLETKTQPDVSKELEFWDKHQGQLLTE